VYGCNPPPAATLRTRRSANFVSAETAGCSVIGKAGLAKGNSVQSIFLKETRGKETIACRDGGQQVAENGGNERAVPNVS
jgi:hypothetical protein